jgi:8-oxo-dGTP diphosphatase
MNPPRPMIGVGVLIKHKGKVLLGKRKSSHGEGLWGCPGGHLEFFETPIETVRRETLEEVGLTLENVRFVTATNDLFKEENKHYVTLFYEADLASGEVSLLEPLKCEEWKWFSWENLPESIFPTLITLKKAHYSPIFTKRELEDGLLVTEAKFEDLEILQNLLEDDFFGKKRENSTKKDTYKKALKKILDTPLHYLLVLKKNDEIIGTLQLNFLENLTFQGGRRAQIEGVRIRKDLRGMGLGRKFLLSALQIAKESDAKIVQLTTNKERKEAFSFYKSLGFVDSHEGFKLFYNFTSK